MAVSETNSWSPGAATLTTSPVAGPLAQEPAPLAPEFFPAEPATLQDTGLSPSEIEALILKFLLNSGTAPGRRIAEQIKLPFKLVREMLDELKAQMLVAHCDTAPMGDYEYELSETGLSRARQRSQQCTYFGSAPVRMADYIESVRAQSVDKAQPQPGDLQDAFADLTLPPAVISQIGQAVHAGRALFLYGPPGNGKTSIAERVIRSLSALIWIPRCVTVTGEIIRVYDPNVHEEVPPETGEDVLATDKVDHRWVRIRRPTIVAGGELTMDMLECHHNPATGIQEAPLQLKSNCGALVIDDFGRQRVSTTELLNRWIIPLEKGHDYLLLSGRHIQVPFCQLLVFSTNLDPRQIVDEAFLRRIPYKVEVFDPAEAEFRRLFCVLADAMGFDFDEGIVEYLLAKHYRQTGRPLRYCHARDILLQVKNLCEFHGCRFEITETALDVAIYNYFAGL